MAAPDDGLPVQCIGPWTLDKHDKLRKYFVGSGGPRRAFLPPRGAGGAAFIDLFAGPGRARVRTTGAIVDGSPLLALKQPVPFSKVILCEMDDENRGALRDRTDSYGSRVKIVPGDSNATIDDVVKAVPPHGLNLALIDPYRLADLRFDTIRRLGAFPRMDLILFFPVGEIRRGLKRDRALYVDLLTRALGTDEWLAMARPGGEVAAFVRAFRRRLLRGGFGYTQENTRTTPIRNSRNAVMYHLVHFAKHSRGDKIWQSVTKRAASGQGHLF